MKPGYKTTEFWLSLLVTIAGFVVTSFPAGSNPVKIAGLVVAVLSQLGYTAGRSYVKGAEL